MTMDDRRATPTHLSLEAEKAVRAYLFRLVVPTGAVLTVMSFLLGFLIQKGAQNEAAKDAFNSVNEVMVEGVRNIASAETRARQVSDELTKLQAEAYSISEKLKTADAFSKSEALVSQVADAIATRQDFTAKVTQLPAQVQSLYTQVDSLQTALKGSRHSEMSSTGGNVKSQSCAPGAYMVGVRMQSDSGGPNGIISTVIPVCRTVLPP